MVGAYLQMAPMGQKRMQRPQSTHFARSIWGSPFPLWMIAPVGHTRTAGHRWLAGQRLLSTFMEAW